MWKGKRDFKNYTNSIYGLHLYIEAFSWQHFLWLFNCIQDSIYEKKSLNVTYIFYFYINNHNCKSCELLLLLSLNSCNSWLNIVYIIFIVLVTIQLNLPIKFCFTIKILSCEEHYSKSYNTPNILWII